MLTTVPYAKAVICVVAVVVAVVVVETMETDVAMTVTCKIEEIGHEQAVDEMLVIVDELVTVIEELPDKE